MNRTMLRLRIVGIVIAVAGISVASAGFGYGVPTASKGLDSAQSMYADQGVSLTYNQAGKLTDSGTEAGAESILALLEDEWDYPVNHKNLDPSDPIVNTRDELMYQYATIIYHVYHGNQSVTLTDAQVPITFRGVTYDTAGTYSIQVAGYYAEFDRSNPIEAQLRNAWSPLALSLTSYLVAGHANQAAGELAMVTSVGIGSIGLLFAVAGGGAVWVSFGPSKKH